jgi:hypothetical protein
MGATCVLQPVANLGRHKTRLGVDDSGTGGWNSPRSPRTTRVPVMPHLLEDRRLAELTWQAGWTITAEVRNYRCPVGICSNYRPGALRLSLITTIAAAPCSRCWASRDPQQPKFHNDYADEMSLRLAFWHFSCKRRPFTSCWPAALGRPWLREQTVVQCDLHETWNELWQW